MSLIPTLTFLREQLRRARRARGARGLSQEELDKLINYSSSQVSAVARTRPARRSPSPRRAGGP
ncbi:hypothetical protein [Micromonospora rubida]